LEEEGGVQKHRFKLSSRQKVVLSEAPCGKQPEHLIHREFLSSYRALTLLSLFETVKSANLSTRAQSLILPGQSGKVGHAKYVYGPGVRNERPTTSTEI
jgi:hypothetical protein